MLNVLFPNLLFEEELSADNSRCESRSSKPIRMTTAAAARVAELAPLMGLLKHTVAGSPKGNSASEFIVLVSEGARPEEIPEVLSGVQFLTVDQCRSSHARRESPGLQRETGPSRESTADRSEFLPWGWTSSARSTAEHLAISVSPPPADAVRLINSRLFLSERDHCWFPNIQAVVPESFGVLCRTESDVLSQIRRIVRSSSSSGWIVKADLSQAARNRLTGQGPELTQPQSRWLRRQFEQSSPVYVEPWAERLSECGLQFYIDRPSASGAAVGGREIGSLSVRFDGACELLTDPVGRYRGSQISSSQQTVDDTAWWYPAIQHCQRVAEDIAGQGYAGFLGIDCMRIRDPASGQICIRMCHDINGRLTMGRLALAMQSLLSPGESGCWYHTVSETRKHLSDFPDDPSMKDVRVVRTSPGYIGGQPTQLQSMLLIFSNSGAQSDSVRRFLCNDSGTEKSG